jgi:hypothetical protein
MHRDLHDAFDRAALRALAIAFDQRNLDDFQYALRPPTFALHDQGPLGLWDPALRRISLRRSLVREATWGQVVEVLRHEMAHQYVSERLRIDEPPHGPAFRQVCAERDIDRRAAGLPTETDAATDRLLRKVRALLALAESPNPNEAEAAARAARRILAEHDLTLDPAGARYTFQQVGPAKQRFATWEKALASVLDAHFGVRSIYANAYLPDRDAWGRILEIAGTVEHVMVAEYVHDALRASAEAAWRAHKKARGLKSDANKRSYLYGLVVGYYRALDAERLTDPGAALVKSDDPELARYYHRRHPRVSTASAGTVWKNDALDAGLDDGRRLTIRPGVGADGDGPRLLTDQER